MDEQHYLITARDRAGAVVTAVTVPESRRAQVARTLREEWLEVTVEPVDATEE